MAAPHSRQVNQILDAKPRLGPFPADLILPWVGIALTVFIVANYIFRVDWIWTILLILWGCGTHWVLVGSKPYRFLSKFIATPHWGRGYLRYQSIAQYEASAQQRRTQRQSQSRKRRRR